MSETQYFDVLIIGSGAAGLNLALRLPTSYQIAIISKGPLTECSTFYAQGGIAAVLAADDSLEDHVTDTLKAGGGLCHHDAVEFTVRNAKECIDWLITQGAHFTQTKNHHGHAEYHLTCEGGHSRRRIIHAADATGYEVEMTLAKEVMARSNIQIFTDHTVIDLITQHDSCIGAYIYQQRRGTVDVFHAKITVLATGGASKAYLYTTNPDTSTGDGIAMAWRAGCPVANLEFNQFHPTCLYHPAAKSFLLSEALRGEGATLHLPNGERFMQNFDERAELAPRDIVARAIDYEMKRLGSECVYLDISHQPSEFIQAHFPTIYQRCLEYSIDITTDRIPVVPAAHYTCGGVITNLHGQTAIANLYAIGEVACTGLHGANRMASNSLLECLVFAKSASIKIIEQLPHIELPRAAKPWDESLVTDSDEEVVITNNWHELRHFMWNYMGIVRTTKRLQRALNRIQLLQQEIQEYYANFRVSKDLLELRNLAVVAELMVRSALTRQESRGLHYSLDFPEVDALPARDTILKPQPKKHLF